MRPPGFWRAGKGQCSAWPVLLSPLAAAFGRVAAARNRRLDAGRGVHRAAIPVISVGGLTVGGGGKTPTALAVAGMLVAMGRSVAIASRGYGGRPGRDPLRVRPDLDWRRVGDEPLILARTLSGVPVYAHPNRVRSAARAAADGADALVLDDGFQHRRLHRDLDVVALDASEPLGNGCLLPAGPLREPVSALGRAGAIWLTRADQTAEHELTRARELAARHAPTAALVLGAFRAEGLIPLGRAGERSLDDLRGARVHLLAGIGAPDGFVRTARSLGARVVGRSFFPDHHPYRAADLRRVAAAAGDADLVLTTEKDAVRLVGLPLTGSLPVHYLRVRPAVLSGGEALRELLSAAVGPG